ncbi:hypothetical protein QJQ45_009489 [Haematococcus lacustris]|nr:hypothetical protein QJQ45_009489 [Haematococcus lacustris]
MEIAIAKLIKSSRQCSTIDKRGPNLLATPFSPRTVAAPAQLPLPMQLDIWDPQLLAQIKDAMELLAKASVIEHMMRGPHHRGIRLLPGEVAVFEQPSNAWPVAMLKQLDEHQKEFYRHPGRFINKWGKAVGVVGGGFSREMKKHFPQLVLGRLDYSQPDPEHTWRLPANSVLRQPGWKEEVVMHRRLLLLPTTWREGQDCIGKGGAGRLPIEFRVCYVLFVNRSLEGWQIAPHAKPHGNSHRPRTCPRPFTMLPMVGVRARHFVIDDRVLHGVLTDLGMTTLTRAQFEADSLPHWQKFIQYSQLQNSGWDFPRRVETDGISAPLAQESPAQAPPAPPPAQEPPPPAQDQPPAQAPPGPVPQPQAPPWGRWLDRDTNSYLNIQCIGERMQRPLELCSYEGLEALPPVGKEYHQGYKRVNDRLPKVKQINRVRTRSQ